MGWAIEKSAGVRDTAGFEVYKETPTVTADGSGSTFSLPVDKDNCYIMIKATLAGTTPSFDCNLEVSPDGTNWVTHTDVIGTAITATATKLKKISLSSDGKAPYYRLTWDIDIANSDETYAVDCYYWYPKRGK